MLKITCHDFVDHTWKKVEYTLYIPETSILYIKEGATGCALTLKDKSVHYTYLDIHSILTQPAKKAKVKK